MKKYILIGTMLTLCGCAIHSQFTYYKEPIYNNSPPPFHLNGIFYITNSQEKYRYEYLCFYCDGTIYIPINSFWRKDVSISFWSNQSSKLDSLKNNWINNPNRNRWGTYIVREDSIFIQYFIKLDVQGPIWRNSIEMYGKIKNNSQIEINGKICNWCSPIVNEHDLKVNYQFIETEIKPDSSIAWFSKKGWYKKDLHESRKVN